MAFRFPVANEQSIRAYLKRREGSGFPLRGCEVWISPEESVKASVPMYEGGNVLRLASVDETAAMVCRAVGSGGRCIDYVRGIAEKLEELHIHDPAVTDLLAAVERRAHAV
jgi:cation transport regulator ChaC